MLQQEQGNRLALFQKEREMSEVDHEGYLRACQVEGLIMGGGDTDPKLVDDIRAHLEEGAACEACGNDLMRGRPDDVGEANFLAQYVRRQADRATTKAQQHAVRCIVSKYGGKTAAELVSRYREHIEASRRMKAQQQSAVA